MCSTGSGDGGDQTEGDRIRDVYKSTDIRRYALWAGVPENRSSALSEAISDGSFQVSAIFCGSFLSLKLLDLDHPQHLRQRPNQARNRCGIEIPPALAACCA